MTHDTVPTIGPDTTPWPTRITVRPWNDPLVDRIGFDPRSDYVETYWLGVIGPTATWIARRLATRFDTEPEGFRIDLHHTALTMGLSYAKGPTSPFGRAIHRLVMFGLAQPMSDGFAVRRRFPEIAQRHLRRLPVDLQQAHGEGRPRLAG